MTPDLNIWHACLLTQAEGSSLFELVKTTMATGFQLSSERHFELIGVQQRAATCSANDRATPLNMPVDAHVYLDVGIFC